jgi:hypothetical protein
MTILNDIKRYEKKSNEIKRYKTIDNAYINGLFLGLLLRVWGKYGYNVLKSILRHFSLLCV